VTLSGGGQRRRVAADERRLDGAVPAGGRAQTAVERRRRRRESAADRRALVLVDGLLEQEVDAVETRPSMTVSLVLPAITQRTLVVLVVLRLLSLPRPVHHTNSSTAASAKTSRCLAV